MINLENRHINTIIMDELYCGRCCCGHQPTSGFCAQAVPINASFLVPFLALSTCFPLLRGQESMSEVSCLCSQAVLHQSSSGTWASQSPHMLLPAHLLTQWDDQGMPQANTGTFYPSFWIQRRQFTGDRRVRYC